MKPEQPFWSLRQTLSWFHPYQCDGRNPTGEASADQDNPEKTSRHMKVRHTKEMKGVQVEFSTWMIFMGSVRLRGFLAMNPPTPPYWTSRLRRSWQINSNNWTKFSFTSTFYTNTQTGHHLRLYMKYECTICCMCWLVWWGVVNHSHICWAPQWHF